MHDREALLVYLARGAQGDSLYVLGRSAPCPRSWALSGTAALPCPAAARRVLGLRPACMDGRASVTLSVREVSDTAQERQMLAEHAERSYGQTRHASR